MLRVRQFGNHPLPLCLHRSVRARRLSVDSHVY
jgi:hypothetical protein